MLVLRMENRSSTNQIQCRNNLHNTIWYPKAHYAANVVLSDYLVLRLQQEEPLPDSERQAMPHDFRAMSMHSSGQLRGKVSHLVTFTYRKVDVLACPTLALTCLIVGKESTQYVVYSCQRQNAASPPFPNPHTSERRLRWDLLLSGLKLLGKSFRDMETSRQGQRTGNHNEGCWWSRVIQKMMIVWNWYTHLIGGGSPRKFCFIASTLK